MLNRAAQSPASIPSTPPAPGSLDDPSNSQLAEPVMASVDDEGLLQSRPAATFHLLSLKVLRRASHRPAALRRPLHRRGGPAAGRAAFQAGPKAGNRAADLPGCRPRPARI